MIVFIFCESIGLMLGTYVPDIIKKYFFDPDIINELIEN